MQWKHSPLVLKISIKKRFHGFVNIRGIMFQILYSAKTVFDLYQNDAPESICIEGVEDIDVEGIRKFELNSIRTSNKYIQLKSSFNSCCTDRYELILENCDNQLSEEETKNFGQIVMWNFI